MQFSGVSRFLPSKRIGALVVVVAALITSTLIIRADTSSEPEGPVARLTGQQQNFNETDTDGDGVKDWEEALWGFSSVSADTDGDGVGDADEVREDRELFYQLPGSFVDQAAENDDVSSIGLAGRVLVSQFLASKQAGVPFTEQEVANAADIAIATEGSQRTYTTYSMSDVTVGPSSNSATLRAYGNAIGGALASPDGEPARHELGILLEYTQSQDSERFAKDMAEVIARYQITIDGFLAVTVPSDVLTLHLATVNAMERVQTDLEDMAKVGTSPFASLAALAAYADDSSLMGARFTELRNLFTKQGIVFQPSEAAYNFMNAKQAVTN